MKRICVFLAAFLLLFLLWPVQELHASAGEEQTYIDLWLSSLEIENLDQDIRELLPEMHIDTEALFMMILEGKVLTAVGELSSQLKGCFVSEIAGMRQVFLSILVLGVLSALFSGFSDLFAGQQMVEAGFYFLYLFLIMLLTRVFMTVSEIATRAVENIILFVRLLIPTYFVAVGTACGTTTAAFYYEMMLVLSYLVERFLGAFLIPFIYSYVLLALLNGIWIEEKLTLLLDFMKKAIQMALKISLGAVTGLSLVQAVIVPVADQLKISAMRKALSALPGVGNLAEGVTELMIGSAVLIKNSMGVFLLLVLLAGSILPLLKILLAAGAVKLGAAVAGIVSDKRLSGCTDRVGEGCLLLFRCVFTAMALFLIVIAVVAYMVSE